MATVRAIFRNAATYNISVSKAFLGDVARLDGVGGGGGGGTGSAFGGGGGKGASYARRNSQSVSQGDTLQLVVAPTGAAQAVGSDTVWNQNGSPVVVAGGGNAGGAASGLSGGSGANSARASTGDVVFTGGNGASGGVGSGGAGGGGSGVDSNNTGTAAIAQYDATNTGAGGASTAAGSPYGGAGGGQTVAANDGAGAQGAGSLTFDTGTPSITHSPLFDRHLTLFRGLLAGISHTPLFSRLVTVRRFGFASITHVPIRSAKLGLLRGSQIVHSSQYARKRVRLTKNAQLEQFPIQKKDLTLAPKVAEIEHTPIFQRLVTLRRSFTASITHVQKMLVKLEARLIPRDGEGGGTTIVKKIFNMFDD